MRHSSKADNELASSKGNRVKGSQVKLFWKAELDKILHENKTRHALKSKTVSTGTKDNREYILFQSFKELRGECGCKLDNPRNFREKHYEVLLGHWISQGLSASTIQNRTSVLRVFTGWIGRPNMIKSVESYVPDKTLVKRVQVAQVDKSWSGNGINFEEVLKSVDAYDERAGVQLRVIKAFGLRREEAVCLQPIRAMKLGEDQNSLYVEKGTKNGLKRHVPIESDEQRDVLALACRLARTTEGHIGWEDLSLKQAVKKMANIMQKFGITKKDMGVTLHGLRHEKMHEIYESVTGQPCPVKGGLKTEVDPELALLARNKMTQAAGHARLGITNAYAGSFNGKKAQTTR